MCGLMESHHILNDYSEWSKHIFTISCFILNWNKYSLSSLSVNYIQYFYNLYAKLIDVFSNLFSHSSLTHFDNLIKYIHCSLIRFNSNIKYLSCISQSLTSHSSNIKSLTTLIPQFEALINNVFSKLKAAITLNITLVFLQLSTIRGSIKCCNRCIDSSVKIINCINNLTNTKCKTGIFKCFKDCLNKIKSQFTELSSELDTLYSKYCSINHLKIQTQEIIKCNNQISSLKTKISELTNKFKCSITEFNTIDSQIKCVKSKIEEIKKLKKELCDTLQDIIALVCVCSSNDNSIEILIIDVDSIKKNVISCCKNIDETCSEFKKLEENTSKLKHSIVFNSYYFQISSYILQHLECIQSNEKSIKPKTDHLNGVPSGISVISKNVREVSPVIDRMNERRDDLAYLREKLLSIIPKLCEIKNEATKIKGLECVVNALEKIKTSIEKLKVVESEEKCLQIFECKDKKILRQSLICIKDKLDIQSITTKLNTLENGIPSLEVAICSSKQLEASIEKILSVMNYIVGWINKMNRRLDNIIKRFIRCSLRSLTNHSTVTDLNDNKLDNQVISIYSVVNVMHYKLVVNRLFECSKKIHKLIDFIYSSCCCLCVQSFEKNSGIDRDKSDLEIRKYFFRDKPSDEIYKMKTSQEIKNLYQFVVEGNHICLCMVIKYTVWPQVLNLVCVISYEMDALSSLSRKFTKYTQPTYLNPDLLKMFIMMLNLVHKLCIYMEKTYESHFVVSTSPVYLKCYCTYNDDKNYHAFIGILLVLSSLLQNLWSMDPESTTAAIVCVSRLIREFGKIDSSTSMKPVCCNPVYSLIVNKECQPKEGGKCCCCWCVTCYNFLIMCVSLCIQCKLCKAICADKEKKETNGNGCKKLEEFCKMEECKCTCQTRGATMCCLLKTLCAKESKGCKTLEELLKKLQECCKECQPQNGCKKLAEKVKNGLCKVLILGCNCTSTSSEGDCKVKCLFFKDLNERTRVAVVVFCKCAETHKCCLYKLIDGLNGKPDKICDEDCKCQELKDVCTDICGTECAQCPEGCPCKTLQGKLAEICKANNCRNGDCLCKLTGKIGETFKKCIEGTCECKNKEGGCCRCPCCKLLGASIKLLSKACKANVLEPYHRITLELVRYGKNSQNLIRPITKSIINGTLNRIYLIKNNLLTSSSYPTVSNKGMSVRNWGYDTRYEHSATSDNINDGYPNLLNAGNSYRSGGGKMFKLVLSRLLIAAVLLEMFAFIRLMILIPECYKYYSYPLSYYY